jgi:acyl-coenzyme A thioesterase PaaI-like protein
VNAGIEFAIPVAHRMGVRIVELGAGHAVGTAPLEGNTNHLGTLYAGTLFGVAEILGGVISIATFDSSRFYPTVNDVQIRFRRPATTPVRGRHWTRTRSHGSAPRLRRTANRSSFSMRRSPMSRVQLWRRRAGSTSCVSTEADLVVSPTLSVPFGGRKTQEIDVVGCRSPRVAGQSSGAAGWLVVW